MLLTAVNSIRDKQLSLMIHLTGALALRNGEVCRLTWEFIDFDRGALKVDKAMQIINEKAYEILPKKDIFVILPKKVETSKSILVLKAPKTKGSVRWMYLTKPILEGLFHHKQQVSKNKLYFGDDYND